MRVIITDLTRFKTGDQLCTAGVTEDGTVIRPWPYLTYAKCKEFNIFPGGILEGDLKLQNAARPHVEDAGYSTLIFRGKSSGDDFKKALDSTLFPNISAGFECKINAKSIPQSEPPPRSLITIKIRPDQLTIVKDGFSADRLRAHLTDPSGLTLSYMPITDLGFFNYAKGHAASPADIAEINQFIRGQRELYVRVGLARAYNGAYWMQLNGIYTFPEYFKELRVYT